MELIRELNYACNSDIFRIAYSLKVASFSKDERHKVTLWIKKIMKNSRTLNELKLRNEFLKVLAQNVENGKLDAPFNQDPPKTGLKGIARSLPGYEENQNQDDEALAMLRLLPAKNGGFILPKPLPQIGAYCYIAAAGRAECSRTCG